MPKQNLQPVALRERIQTIDIIRGFALFGILVVNFTVDNGNVQPEEGWTGIADQLAYWPIRFFLDDKFLSIYCLLFGVGFSIQMLRAKDRDSPFVFVYMRRLIVLYLIGIVHKILTNETILPDYAMVGVLLLILHKLPIKILPMLAILCVLIPETREFVIKQKNEEAINNKTIKLDTAIMDRYVGVYQRENGGLIIVTREHDALYGEGEGGKPRWYPTAETEFILPRAGVSISFLKDSSGKFTSLLLIQNGIKIPVRKVQLSMQEAQTKLAEKRGSNASKKSSGYKDFVRNNAVELWDGLKNWSLSALLWGLNNSGIFPLFLMGLYFGRRKIFYNITANRQFLRNVMKWGLLIGFTGVALNLGFEAWNFIKGTNWDWNSYSILTRSLIVLSWDLGVMILALGYVAGLTLLLENVDWKKRLFFLAPVGRMGLTNYLFHTIPYILLFESFGVGLNGKIGCFYRLLLALPVFVIMIIISRWWFKRFRIGPAEWLWRSLTYWKIQPMRLKSSDKSEEKENENI
jgi:uncharacterized protein